MKKKWEELNTVRYYEYINSIIKERGQWSEEVKKSSDGCERHHIILECKGGIPDTKVERLSWDNYQNIIWLTHKEHLIAHKILAEDNVDDNRVCGAYIILSKFCKRFNIELDLPEDTFNQIYHSAQGHPGEENGMYNKNHTVESRLKMSNYASNRTKEHRIKLSKAASIRSQNSKWYTNGILEKFTYKCPDGWHEGRKPGTNSGSKNSMAIKCYVYDIDKNLLNIYDCINEAGKANGLKDREAKWHTGWDRGPYKGLYYIKESEVI